MIKINSLSRFITHGFFILIGVAIGALLISSNTTAQDSETPASSNVELVDEISREVVRRLLEEGALDEQIELGIQRYIDKQRQAQSDAQAKAQAGAQAKAKNVRPVDVERDHIYGSLDAPVSLIEYSDFECPFCKRFHSTARRIVDTSGGKVNWVYRHFPLGFHNPLAQLEAEASECAALLGGNDAFWRYADLVYERTKSNGKGLQAELLVPFAGEIGLDETRFEGCLDSGQMTARVKEDLAEGTQIGISGTPGNILLHKATGEVVVAAGAQPFVEMRRLINRLLVASQ